MASLTAAPPPRELSPVVENCVTRLTLLPPMSVTLQSLSSKSSTMSPTRMWAALASRCDGDALCAAAARPRPRPSSSSSDFPSSPNAASYATISAVPAGDVRGTS